MIGNKDKHLLPPTLIVSVIGDLLCCSGTYKFDNLVAYLLNV